MIWLYFCGCCYLMSGKSSVSNGYASSVFRWSCRSAPNRAGGSFSKVWSEKIHWYALKHLYRVKTNPKSGKKTIHWHVVKYSYRIKTTPRFGHTFPKDWSRKIPVIHPKKQPPRPSRKSSLEGISVPKFCTHRMSFAIWASFEMSALDFTKWSCLKLWTVSGAVQWFSKWYEAISG